MPAQNLSLNALEVDLKELLHAIQVLRKHYPNHELQLVERPVQGGSSSDASSTSPEAAPCSSQLPPPQRPILRMPTFDFESSVGESGESTSSASSPSASPSSSEGSYRQRVIDVAAKDWVTIEQISTQTGLTKRQIYGVLMSPDTKDAFERRPQPGSRVVKEYRFKGAL